MKLSFFMRIIVVSHWFEYNTFSSTLMMRLLMTFMLSLKSRSWSIICEKTSMFFIQKFLRILLCNSSKRAQIFSSSFFSICESFVSLSWFFAAYALLLRSFFPFVLLSRLTNISSLHSTTNFQRWALTLRAFVAFVVAVVSENFDSVGSKLGKVLKKENWSSCRYCWTMSIDCRLMMIVCLFLRIKLSISLKM